MESVGILWVLWSRRWAVALGAILALCLLLYGRYSFSPTPPSLRSRSATTGFAVQRVLIDTPRSLVADARAGGGASISTRALLAGDLLASRGATSAIARRLGLRLSEIGVAIPGAATPVVATPLAQRAIEAGQPSEPYVVSVGEGPSLPLLSIFATAPDPEAARRLARATTATLSATARRSPAYGGRVSVEPQGRTVVGRRTVGPRAIKAVLVALVFFIAWCSGTVLLAGAVKRRKPPLRALARGDT